MRNLIKFSEFRMFVAALVIFLVFGISRADFFTETIWRGILRVAGDIGLVVIGEAIVITVGEIDLSVASTWALCAYVFLTLAHSGIDPALSMIIVLMLGCLIGLINGIITTKTGAPSFLVTLATMWVIRGILLFISVTTYSYLRVSTFLDGILQSYFGPIPGVFLWFIVFTAIFTILLTRTKFGNHVLAVGGNPVVARNVGVRIERTKILCFMLSAIMAALSGIVMIIEYRVMQPTAGMMAIFGAGLEFEAIAVCMMSGIAPRGGRTSFISIFIATTAYASFKSGLVLLGLPGYWYLPFTGVMTFILVTLHVIGRKKD